jgi:hypothetical protein
MRKHILGFALFNFIVVSAVLIYAFTYVPKIPRIEEVKPPVIQIDNRTSCWKKANEFSYEVESSQFYLDENKLVSKVKLTWTGYGRAPETVYVDLQLVTSDQQPIYTKVETLDRPFTSGNQTTIVLESKVGRTGKIDRTENLYARYNFSPQYFSEENKAESRKLSKAKQVLFIHGEGSVIKTRKN